MEIDNVRVIFVLAHFVSKVSIVFAKFLCLQFISVVIVFGV